MSICQGQVRNSQARHVPPSETQGIYFMRATALYTFASLSAVQSSHKATNVKQAQRTLLCAYSSIYFSPTLPLKLTIPKFFPKLSVVHEKKGETFLGGIVGRDGVRGEKSHHLSHLPQFLPCIWWFSDFSSWGWSNSSAGKGKRMQRPSPRASSSRWPSQSSSCRNSWPGHTFKQSPVEDLAECQCQLMSWEELRPLCQARTTQTSF